MNRLLGWAPAAKEIQAGLNEAVARSNAALELANDLEAQITARERERAEDRTRLDDLERRSREFEIAVSRLAEEGTRAALDAHLSSMESWVPAIEDRLRGIETWEPAIEDRLRGIETWEPAIEDRLRAAENWCPTIETRVQAVETRAPTAEGRISNLEAWAPAIESRLAGSEAWTQLVEPRVSGVERWVPAIEARLRGIETWEPTIEQRLRAIERELAAMGARLLNLETANSALQAAVQNTVSQWRTTSVLHAEEHEAATSTESSLAEVSARLDGELAELRRAVDEAHVAQTSHNQLASSLAEHAAAIAALRVRQVKLATDISRQPANRRDRRPRSSEQAPAS